MTEAESRPPVVVITGAWATTHRGTLTVLVAIGVAAALAGMTTLRRR